MSRTADFEVQWERRLLAVAEPFLDPKPRLYAGHDYDGGEEGTALVVSVTMGEEQPPRGGYYICDIDAELEMGEDMTQDEHQTLWGQIFQAFGDGIDGADPLRSRLSQENLKVKGGVDAVTYDGETDYDPASRVRSFVFRAHLGMYEP